MAEYTNNAIQLVQPNQNAVFNETVVDGCDLIYHRVGSGIVKLYPKNNSCSTRFVVAFSGNVAIPEDQTAEELDFAITIDGEPVASTIMKATPGNNGYWNIATFAYIYVKRPCCSTIGVRNVGEIPTNLQNANIIVKVV